MAYLEPEIYSEHCQTSTMESFAKDSYLALFLIFCETELFYIPGSNFPGSKSKNNPFLKRFLYLRKRNLKSLKIHDSLKITKPSKTKGERRRISQISYKKIFAGSNFKAIF